MDALDDDVSTCLANAFAKLDTADKQRKALNGLFARLPRSRIRDSKVILYSIDFRYDIIGNLPLEINMMIFQHLHLYQVFQARRVARKWTQILSSLKILDPLLHQWDLMGETALRIPEGLSTQAMRSLKAEHIDAYRTGLAFSKMSHTWDQPHELIPGTISYTGGTVAWVSTTWRAISVFIFESGALSAFVPSNREQVISMTLSSRMVAVTTASGFCYVWEITGRPYSFRLPNVIHNSLVSSGKTLAVLHSSLPSSRDRAPLRDFVATWNLDTQRSHSFSAAVRQDRITDMCNENSQGLTKIMVSKCEQSVLLFELVIDDPGAIYFIRRGLDGHVQSSGYLTMPTNCFYSMEYGEQRLSSDARFPTIWSYVSQLKIEASWSRPTVDEPGEPSDLVRVLYDPDQDCLRCEHHFIQLVQSKFDDRPNIENIFFWKDVAYYRADCSEAGLRIIDLKDDKCRAANMGWHTSADFERFNYYDKNTGDHRNPFKSRPLLFGDETYLVNVFSDGFVAWCFDKNITMANKDEEYRSFKKDALWRK